MRSAAGRVTGSTWIGASAMNSSSSSAQARRVTASAYVACSRTMAAWSSTSSVMATSNTVRLAV
ncbi:MAG TPA: hypothetical protein VFH66_12905 [Mycobacteriales bacterium]|nr:hypothetical protein [Mycobacteriales bacterium]